MGLKSITHTRIKETFKLTQEMQLTSTSGDAIGNFGNQLKLFLDLRLLAGHF